MLPRRFWNLLGATAAANLGDGIALVGLPLLAATLTRDPAELAGLAVALQLPWLILALPAGALIDRWDRRAVLVAASLARVLLLAVLALLVLAGLASLPLLYVLALGLGCAEVFFDTTAQTLPPAVVPPELLERANSRMIAATLLGNQFAGPPLGSALFALGAALPLLAQGALLSVTAGLAAALRGSFRPTMAFGSRQSAVDGATADCRLPTAGCPHASPRAGLAHEIAEGARWLWRQRLIRTLAIVAGLTNLVSVGVQAVLVLFALEVLGVSEATYGVMLAAAAIGGLLGALLAERISRRLGMGTTIFAAIVLEGMPYAGLALAPNAYVAAGMLALSAFAVVNWNVQVITLRQQLIPADALGRVLGVVRLISYGTQTLGAALGGLLAARLGLTAPIWLLVATFAAVALAVLPIVNNRTVSAARAEAGAAPV